MASLDSSPHPDDLGQEVYQLELEPVDLVEDPGMQGKFRITNRGVERPCARCATWAGCQPALPEQPGEINAPAEPATRT